MKINDLEFHLVAIPRSGSVPAVRSLLVRLSTDSGCEGWGESGLGWRPAELAARRDALLPALAGRSIFDIEELHTLEALSNPALRCAVEMACWDLVGQAAGQPLCHLFGGGFRRRAPLAVRLSGHRPERLARAARELAAHGFHCQVLEATGQVELDRENLLEIREGVGDTIEIRVDGMAQYDTETARDLCGEIEYDKIQFLLDPLQTRDLYSLASLGRQTIVPLAAWRMIRGPSDVLIAVRCGAAPFVVLDLELVGGLSPVRACAAVAGAGGVCALLGGRPSLGIATAAMLHLAAAHPAFSAANECAYHELYDDVLCEPLTIEEGMMTVPQAPGLGVDVDRAKLEKYAVAGQ